MFLEEGEKREMRREERKEKNAKTSMRKDEKDEKNHKNEENFHLVLFSGLFSILFISFFWLCGLSRRKIT